MFLNGTQSPLIAAGNGIGRNFPQKLNPPVTVRAKLDAFHQRLEVRRVSFAPNFHADLIPVGGVFIAVNGITHLAEVMAKLCFFLPYDGVFRDWQGNRGQNEQNGTGDDQLKKRQAGFGRESAPRNLAADSYHAQHRSVDWIMAGLAALLRSSPAGWRRDRSRFRPQCRAWPSGRPSMTGSAVRIESLRLGWQRQFPEWPSPAHLAPLDSDSPGAAAAGASEPEASLPARESRFRA